MAGHVPLRLADRQLVVERPSSLPQGVLAMSTGWKWVLGIGGLVAVVWTCNSLANSAVEEKSQVTQSQRLVGTMPVGKSTSGRQWTALELASCEISPQTMTSTACGRAWINVRAEAIKAFERLPAVEQALIGKHRATSEDIRAYFRVANTPVTNTDATALCTRTQRWAGQMETAIRDVQELSRADMLGFEVEFLKWRNLMMQFIEHCP